MQTYVQRKTEQKRKHLQYIHQFMYIFIYIYIFIFKLLLCFLLFLNLYNFSFSHVNNCSLKLERMEMRCLALEFPSVFLLRFHYSTLQLQNTGGMKDGRQRRSTRATVRGKREISRRKSKFYKN